MKSRIVLMICTEVFMVPCSKIWSQDLIPIINDESSANLEKISNLNCAISS